MEKESQEMTAPIKPDLESMTTHARIHDGLDLADEIFAAHSKPDLTSPTHYDPVAEMHRYAKKLEAERRTTPAPLELIQECQRLREENKWNSGVMEILKLPNTPKPEWLEQAYREVQGVMLDNLLNAAQKKEFIIAILKGQLSNPPPQPAEM